MPALSPQAILEGRSSNRTPMPVIVGLIVSGICFALIFAYYFAVAEASSVGQGTLLAMPTAIVLIGLILLIDRLEPEPRVNLLLAFGWGAGVSVIGALILNSFGGLALEPALGVDAADYVSAAVIAPVVEESFKGALLLVLLAWRRHEIDGPTDGIVYAGLAALGFALVENVLYYMRGIEKAGGAEGVSFWSTVVLRGVITPLGHPLYTAMIGLGVAYAARHQGVGRFFAIVGGWLAAVLLHGMWNGSTIFGVAGLAVAYLIELVVLIVVVVVLVLDRIRLVSLIRTYLPAYIPSGLVLTHDVGMLGSMAGRRRARRWAWRQAGPTGARAMGDYQLAATELALLHAHAANRAVTPAKFHTRRDAILTLMRAARNAFFHRLPKPPPPPWARQDQSGFFQLPPRLDSGQLPAYRPPAGVPPHWTPPPRQGAAPAPGPSGHPPMPSSSPQQPGRGQRTSTARPGPGPTPPKPPPRGPHPGGPPPRPPGNGR